MSISPEVSIISFFVLMLLSLQIGLLSYVSTPKQQNLFVLKPQLSLCLLGALPQQKLYLLMALQVHMEVRRMIRCLHTGMIQRRAEQTGAVAQLNQDEQLPLPGQLSANQTEHNYQHRTRFGPLYYRCSPQTVRLSNFLYGTPHFNLSRFKMQEL